MTPERWQQIKAIFYEALERAPDERSSFIASACAGDEAARREISQLISVHEETGQFLDSPALEMAARSIAGSTSGGLVQGQTIKHYKIIKSLGAGGMGQVYLAEDMQFGRNVAIKFLSPESMADPQAKRRLLHEAKTVAKLDHPNICSIYEVAEENNTSFIVMQYIEGKNLASNIHRKPMELREVVDVATQVADALSEAHSRGIIHRDVKPQNIMITSHNRVKVMDFGLAKAVGPRGFDSQAETQSLITAQGMIVGTLPYMSPEQVRGEVLDGRSDIFSFGVVLYEMITGRQPFGAANAASTISAILMKEAAPVLRYAVKCPEELQRIVGKCLEKDRERRYQTMRDLALDLEHCRRELETANTTRLPDDRQNTGTLASTSPHVKRYGFFQSRRALIGTAALVIMLGAAIAYALMFRITGPAAVAPEIKSLAVLPLENLSGDPSQEYFADGMTEALISNLSQVHALRVTSRTSVMGFKGSRKSLKDIAQELKVDAVVEGSVQRDARRVKITARLVRAPDGMALRSFEYERELADVLKLESDVARAITEEIRIHVTAEERALFASAQRVDPEAHNAYLLGLYHWNKRTEEGLKKGIEYFQQAVDKEPNYALGYAGLAQCYHGLASGFENPQEFSLKAKTYAEKALALDGTLAEARTTLASIKAWYEWDFTGAELEFKQTIDLNPGYPTAHQRYSLFLIHMGHTEESFTEIRRALELDPISLSINSGLGLNHYHARQYDEASSQLRKTLDMDPNYVNAHIYLGQVYTQQRKYAEAIVELNKAIQVAKYSALDKLGYAYAVSGEKSKAREVLAELKKVSQQRYVSQVGVAAIYVGLGEKDQAFDWLEKGFQMRSNKMVYLKAEPMFDSLHSDPRWNELLRRMNFPPA
jgi:serine/threonine-protein kinase